jgi:uncharacterized protein YkwD
MSSSSGSGGSHQERSLFQQLLNNNSFSRSVDDSMPGFSSGSNNVDRIRARFVDEALTAHNACRAKHGVEPLALNADITQIAQTWADMLVEKRQLINNGDAKHEGKSLGESLGFFYDSRVDFFTG